MMIKEKKKAEQQAMGSGIKMLMLLHGNSFVFCCGGYRFVLFRCIPNRQRFNESMHLHFYYSY